MGRRVLKAGRGLPADGARGFTLVESIIAMAIGIIVLLANLFLFSTAQKNLAAARVLTEATNLATTTIAGFRSMTIAEIEAAAPTLDPGPNPLAVRRGSDTVTVAGTPFARAWIVSRVDLEHDGVADLAGDLVRIRVEVGWTAAGRAHQVTMTTFATGKQS